MKRKKRKKKIFFFKQKTAYEIKECDWSSDVCSSDLLHLSVHGLLRAVPAARLGHLRPRDALLREGGRREIGRASCRERV